MNLPTNSSISVTLSQDDLRTLTLAATSESFSKDTLWLNGKEESLTSPRSKACLADLRRLRAVVEDSDSSLPKLSTWPLHIVSENNFPTAAGLASSAAGFAALVAAVAALYKLPSDFSELSKIARKGSGLACRSLFGGFVAWEMGEKADGEDSMAVQVAPESHWPTLKAAILVVSDDKKDTPSTTGMQETVGTSDLFQYRVCDVVPPRFVEMKKSIIDKDFPTFANLTMKDSNSFHALCLDTFPPIFYLTDTSKKIIKLVHRLNQCAGTVIAAYTFDAGPNAVIYYDESHESQVLGLIYKHFGKVSGWGSKIDVSKWDQDLVPDQVDADLHLNVSRVILTLIGKGPQHSDVSLMNEKGLPN